jgi:hypothetical protein
MNQSIEDLSSGDGPVQHQAFSSKSLRMDWPVKKETMAVQFTVTPAVIRLGYSANASHISYRSAHRVLDHAL